MAAPVNYTEFNNRLNTLIGTLIRQRGEIAFYADHPTWFAASGKTALQAAFGAMVTAAKPELDDLNTWAQAQ